MDVEHDDVRAIVYYDILTNITIVIVINGYFRSEKSMCQIFHCSKNSRKSDIRSRRTLKTPSSPHDKNNIIITITYKYVYLRNG